MANQRRDQVSAPFLNVVPGSNGAASGADFSPGGNPGGAARMLASAFGQMADRIGNLADRAAAKDGEERGRRDGLDPEFRPTGDVTIRGAAYDAAGIDTYRAQMSTKITEQLEGLVDKHGDNPSGLATAIDSLSEGWGNKLIDEVKPDFQMMIGRQKVALVRQATRARQARIVAEQKSAHEADVMTRSRRLQQMAYRLGLDPEADKVLASEVEDFRRRINAVGADGRALTDRGAAKRLLLEASVGVATARLQGAFQRLPDLASRQQFVADLTSGYQKGGDQLLDLYTPDEFQGLVGSFASDIRSEKAAADSGSRQVMSEVKSFGDMAEKGFMPGEADLAALKGRVAASGSPELIDAYNEAETVLKVGRSLRSVPPAQLEAMIASERAAIANAATPAKVARLALAESILGNMRSTLKEDPLEWAERSQLIKVPPLDFSSPQALAGQLKQRAALADQIGDHFDVAPKYFRKEERAALSELSRSGGRPLLDFLQTAVPALGDNALSAIGEFATDAPIAATLGGMMHSGANPQAIVDAAKGLELRALGKVAGRKSLAPSDVKANEIGRELLAGALVDAPATAAALIETAGAIYEARAERAGITDLDETVWQQSLREALGERDVNGVTYGGIVEHNGGNVLLPPTVPQDDFDNLIQSITDADLADRPAIDQQGRPLSVKALRRARLVAIGNGRYFAFGSDDEEQQFTYADGRPFVLDLGAMAPELMKRIGAD